MPFIDPRDIDLAKVLIRHSVKAKKDDLVYIQAFGLETGGLAHAIAEEAMRAGAAPYIELVDTETQRSFLHNASESVMKRRAKLEKAMMKDATCYIGIRGGNNIFETADVSAKQNALYAKHIRQPVHFEERVKRTRWCVLRYPNSGMAQLSREPRETFAEFYYRVCTVDYAKMDRAAQPLKKLMERTDEVHITGVGTDLRFSIKKIPVIPCSGSHNIPDGECFTAPVKKSINGTVHYNADTVWEGTPFEQIRLQFKDGKVVDAKAANRDQTRQLNKILDRDAGARYVGEFALGYNPFITAPMRDILFDEKIGGSFHMALGQAYEDADNGNRSSIHWDMVCIQTPSYGGGEIHFDGKLIRKNGQFVPAALKKLNPEAFGAKGTARKPRARAKKK